MSKQIIEILKKGLNNKHLSDAQRKSVQAKIDSLEKAEGKTEAKEEKVAKQPREKKEKVVKQPKEKKEAEKEEEFDNDKYCRELIAQEKEKKAKRKEAAEKRKDAPKKKESTKIKEGIEKLEDKVDEKVAKNKITRAEIIKLIDNTKALLKSLEKQLKEFDSDKMAEGGNVEDEDDYGTFEIYKNGGNVQVKVVNSKEKYDKKKYNWILGDFDKDGVANADDFAPYDKNKDQRIDSPNIEVGLTNLIGLKGKLDSTMYQFIDDLKNVAPSTSTIYARTKTPFSVLNKLIAKRLSTITDLIGTTIVTKDKNELDTVKRYVESGKIGKVVEIEDMYAKPKNGYMAYHFLIERNGITIELQLKTKRQKFLNELSHEPYKLGQLNSAAFLKMTQLANRADEGNKDAIKQYNDFMNQSNIEKVFYKENEIANKFAKGGSIKRTKTAIEADKNLRAMPKGERLSHPFAIIRKDNGKTFKRRNAN